MKRKIQVNRTPSERQGRFHRSTKGPDATPHPEVWPSLGRHADKVRHHCKCALHMIFALICDIKVYIVICWPPLATSGFVRYFEHRTVNQLLGGLLYFSLPSFFFPPLSFLFPSHLPFHTPSFSCSGGSILMRLKGKGKARVVIGEVRIQSPNNGLICLLVSVTSYCSML